MPNRALLLAGLLALFVAPMLLARGEDAAPEPARMKAIAASRAEKDASAEKPEPQSPPGPAKPRPPSDHGRRPGK